MEELTIKKDFSDLYKRIDELEQKVKHLTFMSGIVRNHTPNPSYIKDINLKYITGNDKFKEYIRVPTSIKLIGKTDSDLLNTIDARKNSEEDRKVILTGESIENKEQYIIGTRKTKWGSTFKIPILDSEKKVLGLLAVFNDITLRKKEETARKLLESALETTQEFLWVGKGLRSYQGRFQIKQVLYSHDSPLKKALFGDEKSNMPMEQLKIWNSMKYDMEPTYQLTDNPNDYPQIYKFKIDMPGMGTLKFRGKIYFNKDNNLYIGSLTII